MTKERRWLYAAALAFLALLPFGLIFNDNIWFDEAYTLALVKHDAGSLIEILKTDMHPPLYFLSLKLFCSVFGYSITASKIFSVIGYSAAVLGGSLMIRRYYSEKTSLVYALALSAMPLMFYFSTQQRSYSWCVCFVTLCFIQAVEAVRRQKGINFALTAVFGLLAAYNHFFALLAVAIVFGYLNIYLLVKNRRLFKLALFADLGMIAGYSLWMAPLLMQARDAAGSFWLKGVEPLSVIVFAASAVIVAALLLVKKNRRFEVIFAAVCVLGLQVIGLAGTILVRPFYIARYSVVITGIAACFFAFTFAELGKAVKRIVIICLCLMCAFNIVFAAIFEYNPSADNFRAEFEKELSDDDVFLYYDSSFGVMSYYFPENEHICTYREEWFSAFDNVTCIDKRDVNDVISNSNGKVWLAKMELSKFPEYIEEQYDPQKEYSFTCDFNVYEVWSISK